jgi:TetR/AcrR family transcriptional regulator
MVAALCAPDAARAGRRGRAAAAPGRPGARAPGTGTAQGAEGEATSAKGRIRQAHEAAILTAAETVFARAGFGGATMAEIAAQAGLPKANLHYYFRSKQALYRAVLHNILSLWLADTDRITAEADPREALAHYVRAKMRWTAQRPDASRTFANELLHGAQEIGQTLRTELRALVADKAAVIDTWVAQGRMAPVDSTHLFFTIWAVTQTYADFETQVCAVLGTPGLDESQLERATDHVLGFVLRGCGLPPLARSP